MTAGATGEINNNLQLSPLSMAKRKYSMTNRSAKIQPVPLKINYSMSAEAGTAYIDLMKDVSRLSRKFFRQGKLVAIANIRVTMPAASTPTAGNAVYISTIQNTWAASNAWMKSFAMWQKQQLETVADSESESSIAKFRDFKIYMDKTHQITGNLEPVNMGPFDVAGPFPTAVVTSPSPLSGEWDYSQIVIPNDGGVGVNNNYSLTMHGGDTGSTKGMILGYANSRNVPQSPDPVGPAVQNSWMNQLFDDGDNNAGVLTLVQGLNDELPYDQDDYPGADVNYVYPESKAWCFNRSTTGVNTFNLGGMVAPCGLLRIDQLYSNGSPTPLIIEVELLPGTDRGYHLVNMQEM